MFLRTTSIVSFAALVFVAPLAQSPSNSSEEGSTHIKTFSETNSMELESLVQTINGIEVNLGEVEMTGEVSRSYQITDTYTVVKDGRVMQRTRTIEECEGTVESGISVMGMEEGHGAQLSNPLDGLDLVCTWDEKAEEYTFSYDEGSSGEESLLEKMLVDAEFALLAPDDEIEESDSWVVDLADGRAFFAPGGALVWEAEFDGRPFENLEPQNLLSMALLNLADSSQDIEGEVELTWTDTITKDDRKLAVLDLEIAAELSCNLREELNALCASAGAEEQDVEQDCTWSIEGEGQVLWDLEAGHFYSLEIEYETEIELLMEWDQNGAAIAIEAEMSGTCEFSATHATE